MTPRVEILIPQIKVKYKHQPGLFIQPKTGRNVLESLLRKTPNKYKTEQVGEVTEHKTYIHTPCPY